MLQDTYTQEEMKEILVENNIKYNPNIPFVYVKRDDYHGSITQLIMKHNGDSEKTIIDIEWV
ncbi:hypothetical protein C5B78_02610 [Aeromonas salmonicida]|uniref:hypothetical protein n=1 Tax=Aeromonas salmonicida TaxID=645 RepID=UPI000F76924F|nr:hypothetical protein [Aeromonas salmonicida]RSM31388.1 hypothetical protein C5B78_02610 [Aeromonas salmonicida]